MVRVRLAAPADVEGIVQVVIAAMPYDPQWDYRFPRRDKFAGDHYRYTKMLYEHFLDAANDDWQVLVVELTSGEEEGPAVAHQGAALVPRCMSNVGDGNDNVQSGGQGSKIVAFSVWDVSYIKKRIHGSSYQPQNPSLYIARHGGDTRRDANPARVKAFKDSAADSKRHFTKYGRYAIRLQILGTHPAHWRHGYASALCHWGMKIAAEEGLVVQVVAGKMGHKLYTHLNFKTLGEVVKQVPGEEMKVISHAMVFDPKEQARSVASYEGNRAISVACCVQDTNYGIHEHFQRKVVLKNIEIVYVIQCYSLI